MRLNLPNSSRFFVVMGALIALISFYYMLKSGYHVSNYNETLGSDNFTFHGRPFKGVVTEFLFWVTMFSGGIGISSDTRKGLLLGWITLMISIFVTTAFFSAAFSKVINYSREIGINNTSRKMTVLEQWEYIYKDSAYLLVLGVGILFIVSIAYKRRKLLNKQKKLAHNNA